MARILIVDDEPFNREVVGLICTSAGYAVAFAEHGQAALETLAAEAFDLVLLDYLMPVMDGLTLARTLRADCRYAELPIIGMTARSTESDRQALLAAGMNRVLGKPFRRKALLAVVEEVLA